MNRLVNGLVIFLTLSVAGCVNHEKEPTNASTTAQQDCSFYLSEVSGYKCIQCKTIRLGDGVLGPSDLVVIVDMLSKTANNEDPVTSNGAIPKDVYDALSADDKNLFTKTSGNAFSSKLICYDAARFLKSGWIGLAVSGC